MRIVLPDGEELSHEYDSGGNLTRVSGRFNGSNYDYLQTLEYDKFGQRRYMELGNGIKTLYRYEPKTRRLCLLQSGKSVDDGAVCKDDWKETNESGEVNGQLKALIKASSSTGAFGRFQNMHYAYDKVGNVLGIANAVRLPSNREPGGPAWQGFNYDNLYRLTVADGQFETRNDQYDTYSLGMEYDNIHNITHKNQSHTLEDVSGKVRTMRATTYDWAYGYNAEGHPHAPVHIGDRTFSYDANGNQLGWEADNNGTRRTISWDDENRIQKIGDPSNTLEFAYDDTGERVLKRGQHGMTVYVNQFFTVRNMALASKHIYAGTTRIATKVEPGEPVGYKAEPLSFTNATSTTTEETGLLATLEQTASSAVNKVKSFFGFPGQGLEHRSDRANEVARNTEKNKHLNGGVPGGIHGSANSNKGGNGNNAGNNGHTNNGGGDVHGGTNPAGAGSAGAGNSKAPYDYGGSFLYFYHPDHLGSTAYVTDADGELYEHVEYFPFGETWVEEQANTIQRVPYRYTSKELDEETGLYYYGARYYDPRTSVWQSADPILGDYLNGKRGMGGVYNSLNLNLYIYAHNRPIINKDPNGEESVGEMIDRNALQAASEGRDLDTYGWAFAAVYWDWFGSESVSQVADKGSNASTSDKVSAFVDVATLGKGKQASRLGKAVLSKAKGGLSKAKGWLKRLTGGCSFTAGTLVMTKEGLKPIEEVQEGDIVLARDEKTGKNVWRTVVAAFSKMHDSVLVLDIQTVAGVSSQIITTEEHPFYVQGQGWVEAGTLEKGVVLETAEGFAKLIGKTTVAKQQLAYDLTVDGAHTFFVGEQQVLVHNCPIGNMNEFFESTFGAAIKSISQKNGKRFQGQAVYKITKKSGNPYLRKGDQYYLDAMHKDHLEVFDKHGNARAVLNLDGTLNEAKTAAALAEGRVLKD